MRTPVELGEIPLAWRDGAPVTVKDVARVERNAAPSYKIVSADGVEAVLLNVYSQPGGNTVAIADALHEELNAIRRDHPGGIRLALFYDQSLFVREGSRSVWESIGFGLLLSVAVLYLFLRSAKTTLVAIVAIPACLLMTVAVMYAAGMSFNLMTLGGIAAAIGLIIDDAIVVVEAMYSKQCAGRRLEGEEASYVLEGDRVVAVRVLADPAYRQREQDISLMPLRSQEGARVTLNDVSNLEHEAGLLEMHREDQRQFIAVSGRFSGVDLRSGIAAIKKAIREHVQIPSNATVEFGGLYQQQQESFANLTRVLVMAVLLVFAVLVLEFGTLLHPLAIVTGSALALPGVVGALWLTGVSLNIVSFLGGIIGFGIVAKNGPEVANATVVPVAAVADRNGAAVVTVIREGKAYETEVEVGIRTPEVVQILGGLTAGEIVAAEGGYGLPDGCPVKVEGDGQNQ